MSPELNKDGIPSRRTNQSNQTMYRDLVIFEERLRGNMTRLVKRKRKYESKLMAICFPLINNVFLSFACQSICCSFLFFLCRLF